MAAGAMLPPLVTTGLDPVVHAEVPPGNRAGNVSMRRGPMDCRVEPGNKRREKVSVYRSFPRKRESSFS